MNQTFPIAASLPDGTIIKVEVTITSPTQGQKRSPIKWNDILGVFDHGRIQMSTSKFIQAIEALGFSRASAYRCLTDNEFGERISGFARGWLSIKPEELASHQ